MKNKILLILAIPLLCMGVIGCDSDSGDGLSFDSLLTWYPDPIPEIVEEVYSAELLDAANDGEFAPGGNPPYSSPINYAPADLTRVAFGVFDDYLYMTMEFNAAVPTEPVHIEASGEVEEQWVTSQSGSINWNNDGLPTGAGGEGISGIDSFAGYTVEYGGHTYVYINYGFPDGDIHHNEGQIDGEILSGGPGYDFIVARFPISSIPDYFTPGDTLEWSGWSEAESYDAPTGGNMMYHHFFFDDWAASQMWTIPAF